MSEFFDPDRLDVQIFDAADPVDRAALAELRADPGLRAVLDTLDAQVDDLLRSRTGGRPLADAAGARAAVYAAAGGRERYGRWGLLPWSATLLRLLPPEEFAALRTDRNRLLITPDEQRRLRARTIAVAGLSVGAAIAQTLAQQGIGTRFHLADPDLLDLSNLNRLRARAAGAGLLRAWLAATARGLAVHPWGSALFLAALADAPERAVLPAWLAEAVDRLARDVGAALPAEVGLPFMLLRLGRAPAPSERSARIRPQLTAPGA
ncbi:MAG: hypothetical protein RIT45_340 [Pseudomonadota bacterium]|jgi:hypothetical protein